MVNEVRVGEEAPDFSFEDKKNIDRSSQAGHNMNEIDYLLSQSTQESECLCFDQKICDIHIDEGGYLVCRHGNNEAVVGNVATVICPLEIASERKKWGEFLRQEMSGT